MNMTSREKKSLRQIAHHLSAVVTVSEQGLSEGVVNETERALSDHELIKVRLSLLDRTDRNQIARDLAAACDAVVVQTIGKVTVLFRKNPKADPRLSNISRYS